MNKTTASARATASSKLPKSGSPRPAGTGKTRSKAGAAALGAFLSPEQRHEHVRVAAYYLAEKRGFSGGSEMEDWLAAEAQVDEAHRASRLCA